MTTGNTTHILLWDCFSLCPHLFKLFLNFYENCSHYWNAGTKTHQVYEFLNPTIQSWIHYFIWFKTFCEYLYNGGQILSGWYCHLFLEVLWVDLATVVRRSSVGSSQTQSPSLLLRWLNIFNLVWKVPEFSGEFY